MLGNVREWVADWKGNYQGGTVKDPVGAFFRLGPGLSGRQLVQPRRNLPVRPIAAGTRRATSTVVSASAC